MQEQVTAEEIILAIVENMHQSLEPLLYTTWAPSLYHVCLRRSDYERLRGLFTAIVAEAKQALDQELESLNAKAKGSGGLLGRFRKEQPQPRRHQKPADGWNISFSVVEDDFDEAERYRVESWLVPPPQPDFDPSRQTIRVRTVGSSGAGERFKTLRVSGESAPTPPQQPAQQQPAQQQTAQESPAAARPAARTPDATTTTTQAAPPSPRAEMSLHSGAPESRPAASQRGAEGESGDGPAPARDAAQTRGDSPTRDDSPTRFDNAHALSPSDVPTAPPSGRDLLARLRSGSPAERTERGGSPSVAPTERTRERVYAVFTFADNDGRRTYRMTKPQVAVGRGRVDYWVDIKLKTKSDVSHEHAVVRYDEAARRFFIKDLSTFGTTVNGVRVPSSVERVGAERRDLDVWVPLPNRALIGLADVIDLDFAAAEGA